MEYNLGIEQGRVAKKNPLPKVIGGIVFIGIFAAGLLFFFHGKDSFFDVRFSAHTLLPVSVEVQDAVSAVVLDVEEPVVPKPVLPKMNEPLNLPENVTAQAIMVKDLNTGALLYGKDEYEVRPMASITKLMTALILLEHGLDWEQELVVTSASVIDNHMYAGDTYTTKELWHAMLVASSNKAAYTLAESTGWGVDAFVSRMNDRAVELGLGYTRFADPTGLDSANVSTAADISLLLDEVLRFDEIRTGLQVRQVSLYSTEKASAHTAWNTNWLLLGWIPHDITTFIAGKTGYITESGYNFTMRVGNDRGNMVHVVVLGSESHEARFTDARDVVNAVFRAYSWPEKKEGNGLELAGATDLQ